MFDNWRKLVSLHKNLFCSREILTYILSKQNEKYPLTFNILSELSRAFVQITDLEDFIPLIQLNIKENEAILHGKAEAKALKWGEQARKFLPPPDYILFADCIYYEEVCASVTTHHDQY